MAEETQTQTGTNPKCTDPISNATSTPPTQSPGHPPDPKTQFVLDLTSNFDTNSQLQLSTHVIDPNS